MNEDFKDLFVTVVVNGNFHDYVMECPRKVAGADDLNWVKSRILDKMMTEKRYNSDKEILNMRRISVVQWRRME